MIISFEKLTDTNCLNQTLYKTDDLTPSDIAKIQKEVNSIKAEYPKLNPQDMHDADVIAAKALERAGIPAIPLIPDDEIQL